MNVILLFVIIPWCWVDVEAVEMCLEMVQPEAEDASLRIPENSVVEGGLQSASGWYRTVEWKQNVKGNLQLTYDRQDTVGSGRGQYYRTQSKASIDICNFRETGEKAYWALIVREALGIPEGCPVEKGEVKTNGAFFLPTQCKTISVDPKIYRRQRVYLDLSDGDGNKLLTGRIEISP